MNWNALEWDRAAEELTWERVTSTLPVITDVTTQTSISIHLDMICYTHLQKYLFSFLDAWP